MTRPSVLFDRDGVLNVEFGYVHSPDMLMWTRDAPEAVAWLNRRQITVAVITNQGGIAHGLYTVYDVRRLHLWMQKELMRQSAHIDVFYFCPHHPLGTVDPFVKHCPCRKPSDGMLQRAAADCRIDRQRCLFIGDKPTDMAAARQFGIRGHLFTGGSLCQFLQRVVPDTW